MENASETELIQMISNEDIQWDGTLVGVMPVNIQGASLALLNKSPEKEEIIPFLLDALVDEEKMVAAHYLLSSLTNVQLPETPTPPDASSWNGLHVILEVDGVSFANQPIELRELWRRALAPQE